MPRDEPGVRSQVRSAFASPPPPGTPAWAISRTALQVLAALLLAAAPLVEPLLAVSACGFASVAALDVGWALAATRRLRVPGYWAATDVLVGVVLVLVGSLGDRLADGITPVVVGAGVVAVVLGLAPLLLGRSAAARG